MTGYTICSVRDVPDAFPDYPGEMRFLGGPLETEQVTLTYRRMPQHTGGKGGYGHRHKTQEEIYFVIAGCVQFKLDDDVVEAGPGTAIRVAPQVVRSAWNDRPEDVELVIVSVRVNDVRADGELVQDFWPD